jgi:cobyrinic acid a,c-diamide synthase
MSGPARIVVSSAGTGAGKTLVAMSLCAALRDAGIRVRAYKAGPDYIDARLYAAVLGKPAHNLDLWLDGEAAVLRHVAATAGDAEVLVIEGMMGLFDGDDGATTSTAKLAALLGAQILSVIAYADDAAFWFTYPETLDALRAAGAELVAFSPLLDSELPAGTNGLWIGGGYPESYVAELEANESMRAGIRSAIEDGVPAYAECGGLMYLAQTLHTPGGSYAMAGALEGATSMLEPRLHIGYRRATVATGSPLDEVSAAVRAYEFHYATSLLAASSPAYVHSGGTDGAVRKNCIASFLHRHFLTGDRSIDRFVAAAAAGS